MRSALITALLMMTMGCAKPLLLPAPTNLPATFEFTSTLELPKMAITEIPKEVSPEEPDDPQPPK